MSVNHKLIGSQEKSASTVDSMIYNSIWIQIQINKHLNWMKKSIHKKKKSISKEYQSQLVFDFVFEFLQEAKNIKDFCFFKKLTLVSFVILKDRNRRDKAGLWYGNVCFSICTLIYLYCVAINGYGVW